MNLMGAMLISLWAAGWMLAMVRAGFTPRAAVLAENTIKSKGKLSEGATS